jgi:flagellar motor protein MotB
MERHAGTGKGAAKARAEGGQMSRLNMLMVNLAALVALAGCAENSLVLKGQLERFRQEQVALSRQNQELQSRAGSLDQDNQELERLLAQSRQRSKVLEEQLALVQRQLSGVTSQLARLREEQKREDRKAQTLTASLHGEGGLPTQPLDTLPQIDLADVQVRRDGDLIRIELPGARLFESGTANLRSEAEQMVTQVAAELIRIYPDQIIGVEGHTSNDPNYSSQWRSNHRLSVAQALEVYEILVNQTQLQAKQLFVVGYGGNHPIVSNGTYEGKERNRRVELVVYPEQYR